MPLLSASKLPSSALGPFACLPLAWITLVRDGISPKRARALRECGDIQGDFRVVGVVQCCSRSPRHPLLNHRRCCMQSPGDVRIRSGCEQESRLRKAPTPRYPRGTLIESGAILQYLLSQHNKDGFQPGPTDPKLPKYLQWACFAEPSLAVPAGLLKLQLVPAARGSADP